MKPAIVVIGASLGGLRAVGTVLGALPPSFAVPLAIVQHRDADAGDALPVLLGQACVLPVCMAEDKLPLAAGTVYLAPPGYHLLVEEGHFALATDDRVALARPSVDVLFESAAEAYGPRAIGVVLTGTGNDGAAGLAAIARAGGVAIVQRIADAHSPGMPAAALANVADAQELALDDIALRLAALCLT